MNLERLTNLRAPDGHSIPALSVSPESPRSAAVLLHPYGCSKEHMLGLALGLAEREVASLAIDLCGHGENMSAIGPAMLGEVEAAVSYMRSFLGRVGCTGLSIGGRLSLMSSADYVAAVSPAVVTEISPQGKWMFENFPRPGVREPYSGYVAELLKELGTVSRRDRPTLLLYAERDIPMILEGAKELSALLPQAELRYVAADVRPDVQHENAFIRYLPRWFNHDELKFNAEAIRIAATWLAERRTVGVAA